MRKPVLEFSTRSDTNRAVQPQGMDRDLRSRGIVNLSAEEIRCVFDDNSKIIFVKSS